MNDRILESIIKLNSKIDSLDNKIANLEKKVVQKENVMLYASELDKIKDAISSLTFNQKTLENDTKSINRLSEIDNIREIVNHLEHYHIKNGNWFYNEKDLGISALGIQGPSGKDGKDGLPGKDGKQGKDGRPGKDGKDGIDGKDGVDGITPEFEIGNVESVSTYDPAKVDVIKTDNKYVLNFSIPRGRPGSNGTSGSNGKNALINGLSDAEIVAGDNIKIKIEGNKIIISSPGGPGPSGTHLVTQDNLDFITADDENFILKEEL